MPDIQAVKGMKDILGEELLFFRRIEGEAARILRAYSYEEVVFPILEKLDLFERSIGKDTDIVNKEMYVFEDKGGDRLALRPEGSACCLRMSIQHGIANAPHKFFYSGPFFRRERPQKGRLRQFHQIGAEVLGVRGPKIDAELISVSEQILKCVATDGFHLKINSIGDAQARAKYTKVLRDFFAKYASSLSPEDKHRLEHNPLRILDSKDRNVKTLLPEAPKLENFLDDRAQEEFTQLLYILQQAGIPFSVDPYLVRGLDYYSGPVFEWVTSDDRAQSAVAAGGRYDPLVKKLGGKEGLACGFAIGLERLFNLAVEQQSKADPHWSYKVDCAKPPVDVYFIAANHRAFAFSLQKASAILSSNTHVSRLRVMLDPSSSSLKAKLRRANKMRSKVALLVGEDELQDECVTIKALTPMPSLNEGEQIRVEAGHLLPALGELFGR